LPNVDGCAAHVLARWSAARHGLRVEPDARGLHDPRKVCGQECVDPAVPTVALHVGTATRHQAHDELSLVRRHVERAAGVAVARIADLIGSSRQELLPPEDVDDRIRDVELAGQIVVEVVDPVTGHEADVPMMEERWGAVGSEHRGVRKLFERSRQEQKRDVVRRTDAALPRPVAASAHDEIVVVFFVYAHLEHRADHGRSDRVTREMATDHLERAR
jgi:hypothetical protein